MDINKIKIDFNLYLENLSKYTNKEYEQINSDYSIFKYAKEFKEYISNEVQTDASIFSMSVNDILDMEIENGKLVDPDKEQVGDSFESTTNDNENEQAEIAETDENGQATEQQIPAEGQDLINSSNPDEIIPELLNQMFELDNVKSVLDVDANNELDEGEITNFLNAISGNDNLKDSISLEDILVAMDDINNNKFSFETTKEEENQKAEEESNIESKETEDSIQANAAGASNGASGAGSVGGGSGAGSVGGGSGAGSYNNNTALGNTQGKTREELVQEQNTAKTELSNNQQKLDEVTSGNDAELKEDKEASDKAYENYQNQLKEVDEDQAKQVDELKTQIDTKEDAIATEENNVSDAECEISEAETEISSQDSLIQTLNTSKAALDSATAKDDKQKADIEAKKAQIEKDIQAAEKAKQEAEDKKKAAEDKKKEAEDKINQYKTELTDLQNKMTTLEGEIVDKHPEIKESMDAYKEAEKTYEDNRTQAIEETKTAIQESQDKVNELQEQIDEYDEKEKAKEYMVGNGEELAKFAEQFLGCNEADGSADKFLGGSSSSATPWCAAFVEYCIENSGTDAPDWYKNVDNKWYCPSIYNSAKNAGAIVNGQEVQVGDIVLFDWQNDGTKDHVGLVVGIENGKVITIEGNSSNSVRKKEYDINSSNLTYCSLAA